jgi:hypothetical protein
VSSSASAACRVLSAFASRVGSRWDTSGIDLARVHPEATLIGRLRILTATFRHPVLTSLRCSAVITWRKAVRSYTEVVLLLAYVPRGKGFDAIEVVRVEAGGKVGLDATRVFTGYLSQWGSRPTGHRSCCFGKVAFGRVDLRCGRGASVPREAGLCLGSGSCRKDGRCQTS